jgi:uncharacterized protein HemX
MSKANLWLVAVVLISATGVWGCGHQKTGAFNAKLREAELRHAKLEEDYRAVAAAAEQGRKRATQAEAQRVAAEGRAAELAKQVDILRPVVAERDDLRKQLTARIGERDAVRGQLAEFTRDLQSLLGRAEAAVNTAPGHSVTLAIPASRQSE